MLYTVSQNWLLKTMWYRMGIQLTGLDPGMGMQIQLSPCATYYVLVLCAVLHNIRKDLVGIPQQTLL